MQTKNLRELVSGALEQRWEQWAKEHPCLASAVDRVRLVEMAVAEARKDPVVRQALLEAERNSGVLAAAGGVVELVGKVVGKLLD